MMQSVTCQPTKLEDAFSNPTFTRSIRYVYDDGGDDD